ncbi:MAG TPA: DUF998 domain-containing protein [Sediminibacterium sp.]|uniref:DUF998 domain-containing protein n=1 Tax=Sediminibacterium sp. TaxID=1917865 RepID=UPI0008C84BA7|nr:DUF998 domain-containing protein [Sediminibacterium sp.]OHC85903.1 MAG: hypothetical protein A2472_09255 [Sphingobacteriia bacterium RIFOXYC2_FULL_35_18]OHC87438.1 MAG: hypothetical protein A2546_05410 [Sphingobacteriia bacterium RIFOXYD2_FULL_35_12]HLD52429.1 DUF998 domain-containing protein [Sediminibacterium sp.]
MTNKTYAIIGISATILFWATYIIMSNLRPEYNLFHKAVSELGSLDAPNKWIWNIFGYILTGILIAVYSFGLFKNITNGQGSKLPLISFVLSGLFMSLSGIFPGDFDNRQSTTMLLHTVGSFGSYLFFLFGAFTSPKQMKQSEYWKKSIRPTLIFTWLTILFGSWPFIFTSYPSLGQRVVFFFYLLWIFYTAIQLYKQPKTK